MAGTSSSSVVTVVGRQKLLQARAGDISTVPPITRMAFGDGGVDSGGNVIDVDEDQTALNHQIYIQVVDGHTFTEDLVCRYSCTLGASVLGGQAISEVGLIDSEGDLVSVINFSEKNKDSDLEMTFYVDDVMKDLIPST